MILIGGLAAAAALAQATVQAPPEVPATPAPTPAASTAQAASDPATSIDTAQSAEPMPMPAASVDAGSDVVYDPAQRFNRASFGLSMGLDKVLIGPVTHGYMRL